MNPIAPITPRLQPPVPDSADRVQPLQVGAKVPDATVQTIEGKRIALATLLAAQPTALVFYRGGWCPFCNRQLAELQSVETDLKKLGYRIVALSPDRPEELRKSVGKHKLAYSLLSDSAMDAARAFGVAFTVDDGTLEKYRGFGINLEVASGQKHHMLPVPSVFLVSRDGAIRYRYYNPDYKIRLSREALLAAARKDR